MKLVFTILTIGFMFSGAAFSEDEYKARDELVKFLKETVIGKPLLFKRVSKIANNTIEADFQRTTTYSDLQLTQKGLTFKTAYVIRQKNYDLDESGKRIPGKEYDKSRTLVVQYELIQSEATGKLKGMRRTISNTLSDSTGAGDLVTVDLKDGAPTFKTQTIGYGDYFDKGNTYYAGAGKSVTTFAKKGEKLISKTTSQTFKVDEDTFAVKEELAPSDYLDEQE